MNIAINEGYFRKKYGSKERKSAQEAIALCKECGFDIIDFDLGGDTEKENLILRKKYLDDAKNLREFCDGIGVSIEQAHARYDYGNVESNEFKRQMIKTVEVSRALGVKNIVIHADTHYHTDFDTTVKLIYEDYAPMVEVAEKCGVNIAVETLFEDRFPERGRFCSTIEELEAIVSKFNSPCVGICWDFGHAKLMYEENQFEQMKRVGKKIIATHVHDNYYFRDLHLPPFFGNTDWTEGIRTLKEIGYSGTLSLEIVYGCLPNELALEYGRFLRKIAEYMINVSHFSGNLSSVSDKKVGIYGG